MHYLKFYFFVFLVCIFYFQNFKKIRPHQTSEELLPNYFSQAIMLIRTHSLFCLVPFAVFLFIYCSLKIAILNCSIHFLSYRCQCIYVMKVPICMYISGISIEMIKAVQC